MLDDLRRGDDDNEEDFFGADSTDTTSFDDTDDSNVGGGRFLGMTPAERMILSIMMFLLVTVIGVVVLVATGRIVL